MAQISTEDYMSIERIRDWDWIPELKIYGPVSKRMVRVDDIINILNRGVEVFLSRANMEKLYIFIKEYNIIARESKEFAHIIPATIAEEYLEKKLFKASYREMTEDMKNNPLDDSLPDEEVKEIEQIHSADSLPTFIVPKKVKGTPMKRPKRYELFKDNIVQGSTQKSEFDNIDLDN